MNVLVLAPHPDDETIGCGGTLLRHAAAGDHVAVAFLTSGELGLKELPVEKARATREEEARKAGGILQIAHLEFLRGPDWGLGEAIARTAQALESILQRQQPQRIYLPHPGDAHPDHEAASAILSEAMKITRIPTPELWQYEVWSPMARFEQVVDITSVMPVKMRALRAYSSQMQVFKYLRAVAGLNAYRGELAARCRYAEVFNPAEKPVQA